MSIMGAKEIMAILAHRYPMLLIDTIEEIGDDFCIAKMNLFLPAIFPVNRSSPEC